MRSIDHFMTMLIQLLLKPFLRILLITALTLIFYAKSSAQEKPFLSSTLQASISLQYHFGKNNSFTESGSHFTLGAAIGAAFRRENWPASIYLQSGVNVYANGPGTNIINNYIDTDADGNRIEKRRKLELDFVNSALLNAEFGGRVPENLRAWYPIRHFNQMTPSMNNLYRNAAVTYGVTYLLNSHHRNQDITFAGVSSPWLSLGMYNDGAVPFYLGDQYDRFWTGGGYVRINPVYGFIKNKAEFDEFSLEYNFNRFTYDVQDGYRLANMLMISIVQDASFYNLLYNNSLTTYKLNWRNASLGVSIIGKTKADIQDLIHSAFGYPHHITFKPAEPLISVGYWPQFNLLK